MNIKTQKTDKKMHICFLSSMHPADDKRVHYKEALSLVQAGYTVSHVCPDGDKPPYDLDNVHIIPFQGKRSIIGRILQMRKIYKIAGNVPADTYHCNEVESWGIGVFLKIFKKKKLIFDSHEIPSHDFAETRFPKWAHPIVIISLRLLFRLFLLFTDRVVLAKKTAGLDFKNTKTPMVLAQNFTDPEYLQKDTPTKNNSGNGNDNTVTLLHLGAINKMRGWPEMLQALSRTKSKNIHLRVIGQFGDNTEDEFNAMVAGLNLQHRVEFIPWIPYDEIYDAMRQCDVGLILFQPVLLSYTHALPHKLFDYMLAELPVIVPDFAVEVADIVKSSDAGLLIDPTDIDAIADSFDALANNPEQRKTLGQNGYKAVLETYNWQNEAKRLVNMYQELSNSA